MADTQAPPVHYVCTHEKALELITAHRRFWISNCGCREGRDGCKRSRIDVCLMFSEEASGSGSGKREATISEVMDIFKEARTKNLVTRPFRDESRAATEGICFCCDDCCGYFLDSGEICDPGELIEKTNFDVCTHCGICVAPCFFKARTMSGGELSVDKNLCYGCGLCVESCPEECIAMVGRS